MYNSQHELRHAVDGLRSAVKNGTITAIEARSALVGYSSHSNDAATYDDFHNGAIHMCPWHTCQATRHN
jgi:hypothetical protein